MILKVALGLAASFTCARAQLAEVDETKLKAGEPDGSFWSSTSFYRPYPLSTFHRPQPAERTVGSPRLARLTADKFLLGLNSGEPRKVLQLMAPGMVIQDYSIFGLMSYWSRKGEVDLKYWYDNNIGFEFEKFPIIRGALNITSWVDALFCHATKEDKYCWFSPTDRWRMTDATILDDLGYELRGRFPLDAISWCSNIESKFVETSFTAGRNGFVVEYATRLYVPTEYDRLIDQHHARISGEAAGARNFHSIMNEAETISSTFLANGGSRTSNDKCPIGDGITAGGVIEYDYPTGQSALYRQDFNTPEYIRDECDDEYFIDIEFAFHFTLDSYGRVMRIIVYGPDHRWLWWQHTAQRRKGVLDTRPFCA